MESTRLVTFIAMVLIAMLSFRPCHLQITEEPSSWSPAATNPSTVEGASLGTNAAATSVGSTRGYLDTYTDVVPDEKTTVESIESEGVSEIQSFDITRDVATSGVTIAETTDVSAVSDGRSGALWVVQRIKWTWWRIIQLVSATLGIVGNSLVMAVVFQPKAVTTPTDTLIGSLAIADFLTSVFLIPIPDVANIPPGFWGEFYCKIIYTARFMWISVSASVFTLTAISVERFIGVTFPFKFRYLFSRLRTRLTVVVIWLMALVLNSFAFFVFFVDPETKSCIIRFPTKNGSVVLGITSYIFVLVIPVGIMLVTQCLTAYALHRQSVHFKALSAESQPNTRLLGAKRRVIKLIFVINLTFVICWAPDQTAYLAFNLGALPLSYLYGPVDRALVVLAFFNSCANPLIYALQYPKFRSALRELVYTSTTGTTSVFGQQDDTFKPTRRNRENASSETA